MNRFFPFSACSKVWLHRLHTKKTQLLKSFLQCFAEAMALEADRRAELATLVFLHDFKGWHRNLPGVLEVIADVEELEAHRRLVVYSFYSIFKTKLDTAHTC